MDLRDPNESTVPRILIDLSHPKASQFPKTFVLGWHHEGEQAKVEIQSCLANFCLPYDHNQQNSPLALP